MKTKDLVLQTNWIRTDSLNVDWYSNVQMRWKCERKNGRWYGEYKGWREDGSFWLHNIYENGKVVKSILW